MSSLLCHNLSLKPCLCRTDIWTRRGVAWMWQTLNCLGSKAFGLQFLARTIAWIFKNLVLKDRMFFILGNVLKQSLCLMWLWGIRPLTKAGIFWSRMWMFSRGRRLMMQNWKLLWKGGMMSLTLCPQTMRWSNSSKLFLPYQPNWGWSKICFPWGLHWPCWRESTPYSSTSTRWRRLERPSLLMRLLCTRSTGLWCTAESTSGIGGIDKVRKLCRGCRRLGRRAFVEALHRSCISNFTGAKATSISIESDWVKCLTRMLSWRQGRCLGSSFLRSCLVCCLQQVALERLAALGGVVGRHVIWAPPVSWREDIASQNSQSKYVVWWSSQCSGPCLRGGAVQLGCSMDYCSWGYFRQLWPRVPHHAIPECIRGSNEASFIYGWSRAVAGHGVRQSRPGQIWSKTDISFFQGHNVIILGKVRCICNRPWIAGRAFLTPQVSTHIQPRQFGWPS